jgi:hypothetical protein
MFGRSLCSAALVLAATTLGAQTATPNKPQPAPDAVRAGGDLPAIMQERTTTISGCLQKNQDWVLTGATLANQKETATYKLEGIGDARLALFENKRIEATGVTHPAAGAKPAGAASAGAKPAPAGARPTAASSKALPVFEATAVKEGTGGCS